MPIFTLHNTLHITFNIISRYGKRTNKKTDLGFDGRKGHCKVPEAGVWEDPLDYIITPDGITESRHCYPKPGGIYWEMLDQEKIQAIPLLRKLKEQRE
ncbi:MAG: hypothetical protein JSU78_05030 [Deltaproteobacteria bacterium]|nr:MAG: hypothetical protein JSU78_05030 [Deltaproteobacteria bacterium]